MNRRFRRHGWLFAGFAAALSLVDVLGPGWLARAALVGCVGFFLTMSRAAFSIDHELRPGPHEPVDGATQ